MDHLKLSHTIIKFLLSIFLLSLLFLSLPLLVQSLEPFTINKTYMFLLCNGLTVFIAKNSGLINASSSTTTTQHSTETPEICASEFNQLHIAAQIPQESAMEADYPEDDDEEEDDEYPEEVKSMIMVDSRREYGQEEGAEYPEEVKNLIMADSQKEDGVADTEEEEVNYASMIIEEEHDAEELNKKCDDFIRKMRAAFCSEPRAFHSNSNYNYCYFSDVDHQKPLVAVT